METNQIPRRPRILLLLPTRTYRADDFLSAAGALDVEVVLGSDHQQTLSGLSSCKSLLLRFDEPQAGTQTIVEFAQGYPIDAIVGVDDDTTMLAAMASSALCLPHNSVESAHATRNKYKLRKSLAEAGMLSPRFDLFSIHDDPAQIAKHVVFPCVLKPLSLSASRGVIRANTVNEFANAFHRIVAILHTSVEEDTQPSNREHILVESFIPGLEVAFEGILLDGVLKELAIFDKPDPLDGPFFEETLYITPSKLPVDIQKLIISTVAHATKVLGLREGPVHAELRISEEGAWMIELAARSIGGLCARTLRFGTGISLETLIIQHAISRDIDLLQREQQAAGVMMIPIPHQGILSKVEGKTTAEMVEGIEDITIMVPIGQEVVPLPEGNRYLGFIFARAQTPEAVETALREAHCRLNFVIF